MIKKILSYKYLVLVSRVILAIVLIFAGIEKIADPLSFAKSIYNYRLFPDMSINVIAVLLPWIELISGILLLFGKHIRENALIINSLLLVFIMLIVISITRGLNIECGCFGTMAGSRVGWQKVLENIGLFLLGLHILFISEPDSDY